MAVNGNLENGTIWKGADGWHTLAKADIIALSVAVKDYVEALFVAEKIKYDLIEVRHCPKDGEEVLIVIDTCEEEIQ